MYEKIGDTEPTERQIHQWAAYKQLAKEESEHLAKAAREQIKGDRKRFPILGWHMRNLEGIKTLGTEMGTWAERKKFVIKLEDTDWAVSRAAIGKFMVDTSEQNVESE